eukprot:2826156-Rhodomonas_salina.1
MVITLGLRPSRDVHAKRRTDLNRIRAHQREPAAPLDALLQQPAAHRTATPAHAPSTPTESAS